MKKALIKNSIITVLELMILFMSCPLYAQPKLKVIDTRKIYDNNSYCAFTGLIEFRGKYYCTFREASSHRIKYDDPTSWGRIVLLESKDAKNWRKVAEFMQDSTDMRDPKIKITPNGNNLMLLYHKHTIYGNQQTGGNSVVRIFADGSFSAEEQGIVVQGYEDKRFILWNATQYKNKLYGFVCGSRFMLVSSTDGVNYKMISDFTEWAKNNQGMNESSIAFDGNKAFVVVRSGNDQGFFGKSKYPFKKWKWEKMKISVGGPNLYKYNKRTLLLGSRDYSSGSTFGKTVIYELAKRNQWAEAEKMIILDSTNDSSYPCIIKIKDNHLMVSYYSREDNYSSNIYIADIVIE